MIRENTVEIASEDSLSGESPHVETGETIVDGVRSGSRGRDAEDNMVDFGRLQRDDDVIVKVVSNVRCSTLVPLIEKMLIRKPSFMLTN